VIDTFAAVHTPDGAPHVIWGGVVYVWLGWKSTTTVPPFVGAEVKLYAVGRSPESSGGTTEIYGLS
jgi:hypothetical protein